MIKKAIEMSPDVVVLAEKLAKKHMKGCRNGSDRPAWKHPEDVAALVRKVPGIRDPNTQAYLEAVAWLHDILEDTEMTKEALLAAGIPRHVVLGVEALTKEDWMTTNWYYRKLDEGFELARIVKACDRICNLREGKPVFEARRWERYVRETREYVWPLTFEMGQPWAAWLAKELEKAAGVDFNE